MQLTASRIHLHAVTGIVVRIMMRDIKRPLAKSGRFRIHIPDANMILTVLVMTLWIGVGVRALDVVHVALLDNDQSLLVRVKEKGVKPLVFEINA